MKCFSPDTQTFPNSKALRLRQCMGKYVCLEIDGRGEVAVDLRIGFRRKVIQVGCLDRDVCVRGWAEMV